MDIEIRIEGIQRLLIHSSDYVRVYYSMPESPDTITACQLPIEAFDQSLQVGERAIATTVLRTVMEIRTAPEIAG